MNYIYISVVIPYKVRSSRTARRTRRRSPCRRRVVIPYKVRSSRTQCLAGNIKKYLDRVVIPYKVRSSRTRIIMKEPIMEEFFGRNPLQSQVK